MMEQDQQQDLETKEVMGVYKKTVMELIDKNSSNLPEGDYLKICDELKRIRGL